MLSMTDIEAQVDAPDHYCRNLWSSRESLDIEEKVSSVFFYFSSLSLN